MNERKFNYTGDFRFDYDFIDDLRTFMMYCEAKYEHRFLEWFDDMSDWTKIDAKTLFTFYRYFEAGHCANHEKVSALDYAFHFFDLPFDLSECRDVYCKNFDRFSLLCFTPNHVSSWKYMYVNEQRNVAIPLQIWSGRAGKLSGKSCGYKFWIGAFRAVEKCNGFKNCYTCWEITFANSSVEFYICQDCHGKFKIEMPPTEFFLPEPKTVVTGCGRGVCLGNQWVIKRSPILVPIPLEKTIGETK